MISQANQRELDATDAPRNDVALLKTITYRAIKTTGTLIVIFWQLRSTFLYSIHSHVCWNSLNSLIFVIVVQFLNNNHVML
jgi:hypothetical protein